LETIPEIKTLSESLGVPVKESFLQQILRHCEDIQSGTINRTDMANALLKACQDNRIVVPAEQTKAFVDMVFKSAGNREELYRVVLKKAINDNLHNLEKMKEGRLVTT